MAKAYTKEEMLEWLKQYAEELGKTPTTDDLAVSWLPRAITYRDYFGSYRKACELAGLEPNIGGTKPFWTKEEMLSRLRKLAKELGREPYVVEIRDCDYTPTDVTYRERFKMGIPEIRKLALGG